MTLPLAPNYIVHDFLTVVEIYIMLTGNNPTRNQILSMTSPQKFNFLWCCFRCFPCKNDIDNSPACCPTFLCDAVNMFKSVDTSLTL